MLSGSKRYVGLFDFSLENWLKESSREETMEGFLCPARLLPLELVSDGILRWLRGWECVLPTSWIIMSFLLFVSSQRSSQECSDHHNKHAYIPVGGLVLAGFVGLLHGHR